MLSLDVKRTNLNAKTFGGTDRLKAINIWKSVEPGENPGGISWKRNRSRCLISRICGRNVQSGEANKNYCLGWCTNEAGNRRHTGSLIGASSIIVGLDNQIGTVIYLTEILLEESTSKALIKRYGRL